MGTLANSGDLCDGRPLQELLYNPTFSPQEWKDLQTGLCRYNLRNISIELQDYITSKNWTTPKWDVVAEHLSVLLPITDNTGNVSNITVLHQNILQAYQDPSVLIYVAFNNIFYPLCESFQDMSIWNQSTSEELRQLFCHLSSEEHAKHVFSPNVSMTTWKAIYGTIDEVLHMKEFVTLIWGSNSTKYLLDVEDSVFALVEHPANGSAEARLLVSRILSSIQSIIRNYPESPELRELQNKLMAITKKSSIVQESSLKPLSSELEIQIHRLPSLLSLVNMLQARIGSGNFSTLAWILNRTSMEHMSIVYLKTITKIPPFIVAYMAMYVAGEKRCPNGWEQPYSTSARTVPPTDISSRKSSATWPVDWRIGRQPDISKAFSDLCAGNILSPSNLTSVLCFANYTQLRLELSREMDMESLENSMANADQKPLEAPTVEAGVTTGGDAGFDPIPFNPSLNIRKYAGDEDPRQWITSLEEVGFLYRWADYIITRYAAMNLVGPAKTWYEFHKINLATWEIFKTRLIQDFASLENKDEMMLKLNRMQGWNELAMRFAEDILLQCSKVQPNMEETEKVQFVIGGLKKEYALALYLNPPKTIDELLEACKRIDGFEKEYLERKEKNKILMNRISQKETNHAGWNRRPREFQSYKTENYSRPMMGVPRQNQTYFPPQEIRTFPRSTQRDTYRRTPSGNTYDRKPRNDRGRTEDGRPICFRCNRPGHVAKYCRIKYVRMVEEVPPSLDSPSDDKKPLNTRNLSPEIRGVGGFKLESAPVPVNQGMSKIGAITEMDSKSRINVSVDRIGILEALVDTGADLSIVDLRTALETGVRIETYNGKCIGPDGKRLNILGSLSMDIKIDEKSLNHRFVVLESNMRSLIIGRDLLRRLNAKINCKRDILEYDIVTECQDSNEAPRKIINQQDEVVPRLCVKLVRVTVKAGDGEYVVEPNERLTLTNGLRIARCLITVRNKLADLWITNPYPRTLKIMKNQTLGYASPPTMVNYIENDEEDKVTEIQINEDLTLSQKNELRQVLSKYSDLFSSKLGKTNLAKHRIDTENAKPIKHKPYRVSPKERDIIKEQIQDMLQEGVIRASSSPWAFPVILVRKRDGNWRFCVDYRKLNSITVKDVYPIPRIDDVMDTLQGSRYFTAIDLRSGYWQVEIEEQDKKKTAFTTSHGLYEFNVMPFGLCNAPATFERIMDNVLKNIKWKFCLCYLDDVVIYSPDFTTHLGRIEAVLKCFRESNLRLNGKIACFMRTRSGLFYEMANADQKPLEAPTVEAGVTTGGDAGFDPIPFNPSLNIRKYAGDEDPRQWITSLEEVGFLYRWADYIITRYAAMNLVGPAKTWYEFHKINLATWEIFKTRLIQDFASLENKDEMMLKLNRMQGWNELAMRFAEDILLQCSKVQPNMEETEKVQFVIGGLKKEYALALYLNPPKTIDELLEACKRIDGFEKEYLERKEKNKILMNRISQKETNHAGWNRRPREFQSYKTENYSRPMMGAPRQNQTYFPPQETRTFPRSTQRDTYRRTPSGNTYDRKPRNDRGRTEDGRPICFRCNRPGHVAKYCRIKYVRMVEEVPPSLDSPSDDKKPLNTRNLSPEIRGVGGFKLESAPVPVNQGMSKIGAITEMDSKSRINVSVDRIGILEALVDTGADLSIVDLRTALETGVRIETYNGKCIGPDGKRLNILGSISMDIKIDEKSLNHRFVVLESNMRSLIIGRDLLRRLNAKINCKRDILEYDIVTECQDSNEAPRKIINQQDEVVPRLCVKLVRVTVKAGDGEYVVEPNERLTLTNGLRIARCLITVRNKLADLWITNPYPRTLKIMKNQTLGYASPPTMVNYIENDEEDKVTEIQINEDLTLSQKNELRQVLSKYSDLFSSKLGKTNLAKHRIDTENAKPIKHKPYRVSPKERDIIKEQIQDMLQEGVIRASSSPWAFPVILVRKRDGNWRFCVDYRKLNSITVKDVYPIPRIDDVMDTLQGSRYFTAIDLRSGYWQVEIEEQDKKKTAFTTSHGLYEFNVMPFGLCNAPATFERIMDNVLKNIKWKFCLCYLDDVVIYSPDFTTHLGRIEAVLKCFRESNLRLNGKNGLSRGPLPEADFDDNYDSLFFNPVIEDSDEYIENIKRCLGDTEGKRSIVENFKEENGCLYKRNPRPEGRAWLLVVPRVRRRDILKEYHNHMICGHLGVTRTMHRLKDKYFWPSMLKDVVEYVRTCHLCQSRKGSNQLPAGLLHPIPAANYPFERVGIDFLGPLPSTKNRKKWMIVLTDYYTKYAETKAVIDATAREVAKFLTENVILKHGAPRYLISDRGSQFTSNLVKEITKICQIQHCLTTSYHPQTNGLTERLNRTLINMISMVTVQNQRDGGSPQQVPGASADPDLPVPRCPHTAGSSEANRWRNDMFKRSSYMNLDIGCLWQNWTTPKWDMVAEHLSVLLPIPDNTRNISNITVLHQNILQAYQDPSVLIYVAFNNIFHPLCESFQDMSIWNRSTSEELRQLFCHLSSEEHAKHAFSPNVSMTTWKAIYGTIDEVLHMKEFVTLIWGSNSTKYLLDVEDSVFSLVEHPANGSAEARLLVSRILSSIQSIIRNYPESPELRELQNKLMAITKKSSIFQESSLKPLSSELETQIHRLPSLLSLVNILQARIGSGNFSTLAWILNRTSMEESSAKGVWWEAYFCNRHRLSQVVGPHNVSQVRLILCGASVGDPLAAALEVWEPGLLADK
ncbi:hypothetical protein LAZ67_1002957, partial [Cordylochernes scorpioides]